MNIDSQNILRQPLLFVLLFAIILFTFFALWSQRHNAEQLNDAKIVSLSGSVSREGRIGLTGQTTIHQALQLTGELQPDGTILLEGVGGDVALRGFINLLGETSLQDFRSIGVTGTTGLTGEIGPDGKIGLTGEIGPAGSTGTTGSSGEQGSTGLTGKIGLAGPIGLTGIIGPVGPTGIQGVPGATGIQGETGETGAQGATGPAGSTGSTIVIGTTLSTGPAAAKGTLVTATAICAPGGKILGGGAKITTTDSITGKLSLQTSYPNTASSWQVVGVVLTKLSNGATMSVTPYAVCSL